jgi:DNA helicase IV
MELLPSCPVCHTELSPRGFDWLCTNCDGRPVYRSEQLMPPLQVQQLNETIAHVTETFREAPTEEERTTWGHVLVDEAQELTPMQWRMLSRRCPTGSFTIVGDLNQSGGASDTAAWADVAAAINDNRDAHVLTLDVNYRTPEEIMRVATNVLRAAASPVDPPRSVRSTGEDPTVVRVDSYTDALATARARARDEVASTDAGTVVVLVPRDGAPVVGPDALDERVVEMGVDQARGLEFDSVLVVEPGRFEVHELYVALTRATARLTVVHSEPLPAGFASTEG